MRKTFALCLLALAGCATTTTQTTELSPEELRVRLQPGVVSVRPVAVPVKLIERTKGQAVGNFLLASVVSSVASSGTGARTVSEMQASTEIGRAFGQELNQALPTGSEAKGGGGADGRLAQRLNQRFLTDPTPDDSALIEIAVSASQWELAYDSFFSSSDYTLHYALTVAVIEHGADKPKTIKRVLCQGNAPKKMALDAWQAEDYAAVRKVADEVADACFGESMRAFGLA